MSGEKQSGFWETIRTILYAVLIALGVRTFAYEPFNIPSGSMLPTLLIGDYLFVSKLSYGYSRHSLPGSPPLFPGRVLEDVPERGDIVVFKLPADNTTDFIKRIVGLPGDEIQMKEGILHINGTPVKRRADGEFTHTNPLGFSITYKRYIETLPNGREHFILERGDHDAMDNTPVYKVPPGHYFGMGDNRDSSRDSRFLRDVGYIPAINLVGRADFLFFSIMGSAWRVWNWPATVRFNRIFKVIE